MQSHNPAFRSDRFGQQMAGGAGYAPGPQQVQDMYGRPAHTPPVQRTMTIDDVVVKGFLALGTLMLAGALTWALLPLPTALTVGLVAFVLQFGLWAFITFTQKANAPLVLTFSALYGVGVGAISSYYENLYNGIVFQAVIGTALAFGGTLAVHSLRIIRMTPKLARFVIAAGFAMMGLMLVNLLLAVFTDTDLGIRDNGPLGITFSVVAILLGCFFLLLDFDMVEQGVRAGAPEKFAWYCAFGLVLSLVWIYLELLRLLSYFRE
ncbi:MULTISPECIES: Bax inhibitor-1/YccA family protein [Thermomonospora]|uniref:Putative YccA/Bax inhibitor family protein n=1 Tax=Thermomonospora cellulosilytica TaxID=1411118 RepID=A0A7W3MX92_9ACTN|nr:MULTISPECIES: Bax inhibitor-1/YccA family protein [Thermomonospora]MBA9003590.1 putative YccA/Bax inhibitor family protein [Thermomonospora cellulosilytica]